MEKVSFKIRGMTCVSCSRGIEQSFVNRKGVEEVSVNFASGNATVRFDRNKIALNDIYKTIEKKGYVPVKENLPKASFKISGMHSDHCAGVIKNILAKSKGVLSSEVNFVNAYAKVSYDDSIIKAEEIKKVIDDAGYEAWLLSREERDLGQEEKMEEKELVLLRKKINHCCCFCRSYCLFSYD